jgi:hypothetical protein
MTLSIERPRFSSAREGAEDAQGGNLLHGTRLAERVPLQREPMLPKDLSCPRDTSRARAIMEYSGARRFAPLRSERG